MWSSWASRWLRTNDLLDARYRSANGLTLHQEAGKIDGGWDVTRQVLIATTGLGWSEEIDPVLLAIVGGCDGTSTLRDQLAILAAAYDETPEILNAMATVIVPHLIERGFIEAAA